MPILCNDNFDEKQKVAKGLFGSCNRTKTPRLKTFSRVDKFRNFFIYVNQGINVKCSIRAVKVVQILIKENSITFNPDFLSIAWQKVL